MSLKFNSVLEVVEVGVRAKFYQTKSGGSQVYQQCTRFRTTLDFDREYLWNESSNRQAENGVINYDFFHVRWKQFCKLWSTNENNDLDVWPWKSI